jgi:hypothetical protein
VKPVKDVTFSVFGDKAAKPESYDPAQATPPQSFSAFHPRFYLLQPIDASHREAMDWGLAMLHSSSGLLWPLDSMANDSRLSEDEGPRTTSHLDDDDEKAIIKRHILSQFLACVARSSSFWQFISY